MKASRAQRTRAFVVELSPEGDLLPGKQWAFSDLDPPICGRATDAEDPFTFGSLFNQQLLAEVVVSRNGVPISATEEMIDVCDTRRLGSLYQRVVERVIVPDTKG